MTANGLITLQSAQSVTETAGRLETILRSNNVTLFARIDHAAGAADVNMQLSPTLLLIFGNPKAGTPLMQADQRAGIDLPIKILIWEDSEAKVWLSYNTPAWTAERHHLPTSVDNAVKAMTTALEGIAKSATQS